MQLKIINARILTPAQMIDNGVVLVDEGKIAAIAAHDDGITANETIDAAGQFAAPGFIDIHVHGGGGHDFMDNTVEAFLGIAAMHARFGTTAITPTTLSCEKDDLLHTLHTYAAAHQQNRHGAQFVGMHMEGPYFSMAQRGAQDARYIRNPDPSEYKAIIDQFGYIKRWSAAPELEGAIEFGEYLKEHKILAAIAHTDASDEDVFKAFAAGYSHATHFYSAMSTVTRRNAYRYAGAVEATYLLDDMTVEIIADGKHLPASLLKLVYKIKGPGKIALITDAMRGAGMPEGPSILGGKKNGQPVIVEDGVAKMPDRTAFAGSVATADMLVRNMINMAAVPLTAAVQMMTSTPAKIMNLPSKGTLAAGKDADIVIFNDNINIYRTIIGGRTVFSADH